MFSLKEVALLRNIRRTASVSVKEDVELMVVDKHVFGKVCSDIYEREMREKVDSFGRYSCSSVEQQSNFLSTWESSIKEMEFEIQAV